MWDVQRSPRCLDSTPDIVKLAFHQPVYDVSTANLNWIPERFVTAAGKKREALSPGHTLDQVCRGLQMVVSTTKARDLVLLLTG